MVLDYRASLGGEDLPGGLEVEVLPVIGELVGAKAASVREVPTANADRRDKPEQLERQVGLVRPERLDHPGLSVLLARPERQDSLVTEVPAVVPDQPGISAPSDHRDLWVRSDGKASLDPAVGRETKESVE